MFHGALEALARLAETCLGGGPVPAASDCAVQRGSVGAKRLLTAVGSAVSTSPVGFFTGLCRPKREAFHFRSIRAALKAKRAELSATIMWSLGLVPVTSSFEAWWTLEG